MDVALRNAWNKLKADPTDPILVEHYLAVLRRSGETDAIERQAEAMLRRARRTQVSATALTLRLRDLAARRFLSETIDGAKARNGGRLPRDVERAEYETARVGIELMIERGVDPREVAQKIGVAPNTLNVMQIVMALRERDLFFDHWDDGARNVVLIPAGWEVNLVEEGDDQDERNEVYGYSATRNVSNDDQIETLWVGLDDLALCSVVTEAEARQIHPALFEFLERVNRGED